MYLTQIMSLRFYSTALLSFCLLVLSSTDTFADDAIRVKSTAEFIDMHSGPGRGYPIFHVLEKNETVELIKRKNDWIKAVTDDGIEGWIHRRNMDNTVGVNGELVRLGLPSREDYSNRRWEIGFGAGQLDSAPSLGLSGGYRFTNNLTLDLQLKQATGSRSKNEIVSLGLIQQPFPEWRFSPYFTLATGTITTTVKTGEPRLDDPTDELFLVGIGGYYYLSNRFMLKLELNQYTTLPSENSNIELEEYKIGFSSFF